MIHFTHHGIEGGKIIAGGKYHLALIITNKQRTVDRVLRLPTFRSMEGETHPRIPPNRPGHRAATQGAANATVDADDESIDSTSFTQIAKQHSSPSPSRLPRTKPRGAIGSQIELTTMFSRPIGVRREEGVPRPGIGHGRPRS